MSASDRTPHTMPEANSSLFAAYTIGEAYDEMFEAPGRARPHYQALFSRLQSVDPQEMRRRQSTADLAFLHQGITFTVYGQDEGTERIFRTI
jgi:uncharacterized circularly permuted ATP-grasp superfamily protein